MDATKTSPSSKSKRPHESKYYGGEVVDTGDEETKKLYLQDCRRRQAALYPAHVFKSPSVRMLMHTVDPSHLLASSGQSRIHLHLQQQQLEHNAEKSSDSIDSALFAPDSEFPSFPSTVEEEVSLFRSHGLPLLVWPSGRKQEEVHKYLSEHYPDCAHWFSEFVKVTAWLEQKWRPLVQLTGLSCSSEDHTVWLQQLSKDSVAANYAVQRLSDYERYERAIRSYLTHRRKFTQGFMFHPIHKELEELFESRQAALSADSGFFNVVGNRLLKLAHEAKANQSPVRLNIGVLSRTIEDVNIKEQFKQSLLSAKTLKKALRRGTLKPRTDSEQRISEQDTEAEDSDTSTEMVGEESAVDNSDIKVLPNRPITKEILQNKGLVKYRHKRERNPRVHLRHKFRKSVIRHRSRVPPMRHEDTPYSGEIKGIRVHLIKSHKFRRH